MVLYCIICSESAFNWQMLQGTLKVVDALFKAGSVSRELLNRFG
jgi:hypothetical protein